MNKKAKGNLLLFLLIIGIIIYFLFFYDSRGSLCEKTGGSYSKGGTDIFGSYGGHCDCPDGYTFSLEDGCITEQQAGCDRSESGILVCRGG